MEVFQPPKRIPATKYNLCPFCTPFFSAIWHLCFFAIFHLQWPSMTLSRNPLLLAAGPTSSLKDEENRENCHSDRSRSSWFVRVSIAALVHGPYIMVKTSGYFCMVINDNGICWASSQERKQIYVGLWAAWLKQEPWHVPCHVASCGYGCIYEALWHSVGIGDVHLDTFGSDSILVNRFANVSSTVGCTKDSLTKGINMIILDF